MEGGLVTEARREMVLELHYVEGSTVLKHVAELFGELLLPHVLGDYYNEIVVIVFFDLSGHLIRDIEVVDIRVYFDLFK